LLPRVLTDCAGGAESGTTAALWGATVHRPRDAPRAIPGGEQRRRNGPSAAAVVGWNRVDQHRQATLEPLNLDGAPTEFLVPHDGQMKIAGCLDPVDRELEQRTVHAIDGPLAIRRPYDEFGQHRVVVQPDLTA